MSERESLLSVRNLTVSFGGRAVVNDLSFDLYEGETLGIVGGSGSGKSVTALAVMNLLRFDRNATIDSGSIHLRRRDGRVEDLVAMSDREAREVRGREIAIIFQEPLSALNPVVTVGGQIAEVVREHAGCSRKAANHRALELLSQLRIADAARRAQEFPHQMSGGMRQRVMIAMALAASPRLLIADEPTTALDVTTQAQILGLIGELQRELAMGVMFITHDMGVIAHVADRVIVMKESRVIEIAPVGQLFERAVEPYTRDLIAAVPVLDRGRPTALAGVS